MGNRYNAGNGMTGGGGGAFPSLPTTAPTSNNASSPSTLSNKNQKSNNAGKKSKTLAKISGIVKKTTEEEKQKQWEAREAARRKALMSNLTYGVNPNLEDPSRSLPTPPTSGGSSLVTEEQIQRNLAFAEALNIKPASKKDYASGWSRPTTTEEGDLEGHRQELNTTVYPDSL